jgi:nickel-dependent lactate racemase
MRVGIGIGRDHLELDVPERALVEVRRGAASAPIGDVAGAVGAALETPLGFPPLRRALTPDDHLAVVVDEELPRLAELLTPLFEHVGRARVVPEAITLVCAPGSGGQKWVDDLPEAYGEVRLEVHDPRDRNRLSYLAMTRQGRRIYLNRTVVDADQVIILSGRRYDPVLGYAGAEGALFPVLADEAIRREAAGHLTMKPPAKQPSGWRQQATEVAWLLGAPFLVQIIEGSDAAIEHVIGGPVATSAEGQRLLDARWHVDVQQAADLVVAGIGGDPAGQTLADMARALACAARVVKPQGRIVLLCAVEPHLGSAMDAILQGETPEAVLRVLEEHAAPDMQAAFQWASAVHQASVYLLSGLPAETAEEMFTVPMDHAGQVQRLLDAAASCIVLPDAHKTMAVINP